MECVEAYHDDFAVDDLLDLSLADDFGRDEAHRDEDEQEHDKDFNFSDQSVSLEDLFTFPGSELELPLCDMSELEWLSNFVEDSFSDSYLSGEFQVTPTSGNDTTTAVAVESRFSRNPVPVKPRTKRKRTSRRVWTLPSPSSAVAGPLDSTPGMSNQAAASNKGKQKVRRKAGEVSSSSSGGGGGGQQTQPRRCSHCGVQKTPQWRMGPLGAKTLCNACGVRFKSGRLLPEYRPACSPTFSALLHSNSHRKVLELRQTKANSTGPVGSSPV